MPRFAPIIYANSWILGVFLRTTAPRRYKMAGPRLGVSPIALLTPLPPCTVPPVNVHRGFHSRFSTASLRRTYNVQLHRRRMHTVKITLITHFGVFYRILRSGSVPSFSFVIRLTRKILPLSPP